MASPSTKTVELWHPTRSVQVQAHGPTLHWFVVTRKRPSHHLPLGDVEHEVATLVRISLVDELGDAEPARVAVVLGARGRGNRVPDQLTTGRGRGELGGVSKVANDGNAGQ